MGALATAAAKTKAHKLRERFGFNTRFLTISKISHGRDVL